ncbi:hypothetical protein B5M42_020340 [Paenibacillus athensensis]|uniref:Ferric oxidoreductase domain-containing protein n=1 Tax=Paenibacillus athensensis TaxID=1967502 RepID=A0A4Y8Q078_9BACL|nr:hypothetical protein [Paenibacillus athensensis]MCD1261155.1 hypothetical protein [Paenibacillus athensensis]
MREREAAVRQTAWIPRKERFGVTIAAAAALVLLVWQLWSLAHMPAQTWHSRQFEHTFKNFGSNARLLLFFVLAYYVLQRIIKLRQLSGYTQVKKWLAILLRFVRTWHTPAAILAIALIILHAVAVFLHGFVWDFNNISGLLALLVLLPVPVSGLLRYKRLDRKWHLRLGLAFAILFLIHAFL